MTTPCKSRCYDGGRPKSDGQFTTIQASQKAIATCNACPLASVSPIDLTEGFPVQPSGSFTMTLPQFQTMLETGRIYVPQSLYNSASNYLINLPSTTDMVSILDPAVSRYTFFADNSINLHASNFPNLEFVTADSQTVIFSGS